MQDLKNKSVFHEIKNQLSVCDLYLEIIKKTLDKENFKNEAVSRAIDTINASFQVIASSMQELKAQINPLKIQSLNLHSLVNDAFIACESYKAGEDIEFINELKPDTEILADKDKMYSVLINLCKNAAEAISDKGYIKIFAEGKSIFVENNGEQIPVSAQGKLFDEGFTTKPDGSGFGLMLVKKYLNSQNFDIKLEQSSKDKTTFVIYYTL